MKVILVENIEKIGQSGDVVKVKDGFARNFLLPRRLALEATKANLKVNESLKQSKVTSLEKQKNQAQSLAKRLEGRSFTITAEANVDDNLYGSISNADIAILLQDEGYQVDKDNILLAEPIKSIGIYDVGLKFHPEVTTRIKIWIVRK